MHSACLLYARCIPAYHTAHAMGAICVYYTCPLHVRCVDHACPSCMIYMHYACTMHVLCMYYVCSLCVLRMHCVWCVHYACTTHALGMHYAVPWHRRTSHAALHQSDAAITVHVPSHPRFALSSAVCVCGACAVRWHTYGGIRMCVVQICAQMGCIALPINKQCCYVIHDYGRACAVQRRLRQAIAMRRLRAYSIALTVTRFNRPAI